MAENEITSNETPQQLPKKSYEKPSFRFEQVFVTTALTCGKTSPVQGQCAGANLSAS